MGGVAADNRQASRLTFVTGTLLVLRVTMETGFVVALGYWGFRTGGSIAAKILLGVGGPLLGFGFWGLVDFRFAGRFGEGLRLVQELALTVLAAAALYAAGQQLFGWVLLIWSVVYHALVYATGNRLLKRA